MELIINFDHSSKEDTSCLTVFKLAYNPNRYIILSQFFGEEAEELFDKLTDGQVLYGKRRNRFLEELNKIEGLEKEWC